MTICSCCTKRRTANRTGVIPPGPALFRQVAAEETARHGVPVGVLFSAVTRSEVVRCRRAIVRRLIAADASDCEIGRFIGRHHSSIWEIRHSKRR